MKYSEAEIQRAKETADIAALIGQSVLLKQNGGEFVGLCPFHSETTPSFHVIPKKKMYYCFGCGQTGDVITWLSEQGLSFAEAIESLLHLGVKNHAMVPIVLRTQAEREELSKQETEAAQKRIERARRIWSEAKPAQGTLVERYLESRGIANIAVPPVLRFHPRVWHPEVSAELPAMIAAIIDIRAKKIIGIHRTYLAADGRGKAKVTKSKLMLGQCRHGHVQLATMTGGRLAVAEGIETALSVMKACPGLSVWAALSLSNMQAPVPRAVTELILCADGDNKDQAMADRTLAAAAALHYQPGRTIRIARPEKGKDFNDMMRSGSGVSNE